jgi:tetratricopeptide (TPR) repeat protein
VADLRVHPDTLTPDMVEPFIPRASEIDQDRDPRVGVCMWTMAEAMSIQSAATWLAGSQAWDFFAVYFDAIDHFCHAFMKYHPPRQSWISERDFELYGNVVSAAYQFHDRMLGALVDKAGQDATVILMSDHGFHPDHLRPASIPDIPAGPAVEHRDLGVLAIAGPGIKRGEALHGASVLDIAPTILALYGLPVGEDMDGKVLAQAFAGAPRIAFLPSWDAVPGADGRHPPHTRLDPVAAHEALEQMIALGYIERPDEDSEIAVEKTIRDLRYNLGEAYQDAARHAEAHKVFAELCAADPDEQRFAVRRFVSCQALGMREEMRRIAEDLDGRRRALFEESKAKIEEWFAIERARRREKAETRRGEAEAGAEEAEAEPEALLSEDERRELARWRNLARYQPAVTDYLKAQVLAAENRYAEALAALERVMEGRQAPPELLLGSADLYLRLRRWRDARQAYEAALAMDPDNARAYLGLCRVALRRREFGAAAQAALDALERVHHYPLAHFLLGQALAGMKEYERAAEAYRAAISCNPNFPEAHVRLAALLEKHLGDARSAQEHRRMARRMSRYGARQRQERSEGHEPGAAAPGSTGEIGNAPENRAPSPALPNDPRTGGTAASTGQPDAAPMPPLEESVVVVTGLPRSGTSMLMQMLAAGGMPILADELRAADEDNPRGYFEFEAVRNLLKDSNCLREARGKAVKIVAPLVSALPPGLPCRVILIERDPGEVIDSQERMLARRNHAPAAVPERRRMLMEEFARTVARVKAMLARRPVTQLLVIGHRDAISDPAGTAARMNRFLGARLDAEKMAVVVDPALHRQRRS